MKIKLLLFFVTIIFTTTFVKAQTKEYKIDSTLEKCIAKDVSDAGMINCLQKAETDWDKELNKYYKLLLIKLDTSEQKKCRDSQRQWLIYKEKEVNFFTDVFSKKDGSLWNLLIADKRMQITRLRAKELIAYYETLTQN
ncbi:lysozyme inhibitor LprI family protein [Ferruginibacter sp.]